MSEPLPATLELTLQSTTQAESFRLVAQYSRAGSPRVQRERLITIDIDSLHERVVPKEYGIYLGQLVFAEGIRELFIQGKSESSGLRVLLGVEAQSLQTLRWERLCAPLDENRWEFLGKFQDAPFSLYLPSTTDRRFLPFTRDELRVLVVIASPPSEENRYKLTPFDVAEAQRRVAMGLGDIPFDVLANPSPPAADLKAPIGPPTLRALCAQLTQQRYPVLHIVCHGMYKESSGDSAIFLEKEEGGIEAVRASQLIEELSKLSSASGLPHFAFLSVCDSAAPEAEKAMGGLAQRLVRELGMPAVLAMTEKISQLTALELAKAFYPRFAAHGYPDLALAEACVQVSRRYDVLVPALFCRLSGRPLFIDAPDEELSPEQLRRACERLRELFSERAPVLLGTLDAQILPALTPGFAQARRELPRSTQMSFDSALWTIADLCEKVLEVPFRAFARDKQKPPPYDKECPFPGLSAFGSAQRRFFHGRDALVKTLCERVRAHPFLAVLGGSGSGKSSLVKAGLAPQLDVEAKQVQMTPGGSPQEALSHALAQLGPATAGAPPSLLIVDQLEELFTLCQSESERRTFIEQLLKLVGSLRVVLTMRADFWGECAAYPTLRDAMQQHQQLISPMSAEELRAAMEAQAQEARLRFETGLSELILQDLAGEPGAMPLLQHALLEVWNRRHGRWLRLQAYQETGRVSGAIARTADRLYESLSPQDQSRMQDVMTRLTRVDEAGPAAERPRDTRQRLALRKLCYRSEDEPVLKALISKLADQRLLTTSSGPDPSGGEELIVELSHEALIRNWERLQHWLDLRRATLQLQQELDQSATNWREHRKTDDYLEHCGDRGAQVREAVHSQRLLLDREQEEYFSACAAKDRRVVEQDRRRLRRLIALSCVLAAMAIFAVAAAITAWQQQRKTEQQRALAQRRLDDSVALADDIVDTVDDRLAAIPSAIAARSDLLESLERLLDKLLTGTPGDPKSAHAQLLTSSHRAEALQDQGKLPEALDVLTRNLQRAQALAAQHSNDLDWQRNLAIAHEHLGSLLMKSGRLDEARTHYEQDLLLTERLSPPQSSGRDLLVARQKLGSLLENSHKLDEAKEQFAQVLEIAQQRSRANPGTGEAQRDLAVASESLARVLEKTGDLVAARKKLAESVALREEQVRRDGKNCTIQHELVSALVSLGNLSAKTEQKAEARQQYEQALALQRDLDLCDPSTAQRQYDLLLIHYLLLKSALTSGDEAAALTHQQEAGALLHAFDRRNLFGNQPLLREVRRLLDSIAPPEKSRTLRKKSDHVDR